MKSSVFDDFVPRDGALPTHPLALELPRRYSTRMATPARIRVYSDFI